METTNNSAQETLFESTKTANKWMSDAMNSMMDVYKKQLNVASGFYSNFFNLFSGENKNFMNPAKSFTDLFANNNDGLKFMNNPFTNSSMNGNSSNTFLATLDKALKQMTEFNQNLYNTFGKQMNNGSVDGAAINEKYQKLMESRLEAIKKMTGVITQAYNKQLEFSIETNKNMQEEINSQMSFLNKQTQKFWADVLGSKATEEEKYSKDGSASEKKQSSRATVEV